MSDQNLPVLGASTEIVELVRPPAQVLAEAREAAAALKSVLDQKRNKVMFNGEQYLEAEDWILLGRFYGITAKIVHTAPVEFADVRGFEARAVALRADGAEISAAEAMCLNDEEKWRSRPKYEWHYVLKSGAHVATDPGKDEIVWEEKAGKRRPKRERVLVGEEPVPLFQLRSMSQTRALAKVLGNVLRWVPVLAGYKGTPAEEMTGGEQPRERSTHPVPPPRAENADVTTVSEPQWKRLWARARAAGHKDDDTIRYLAERWKIHAGRAECLRTHYEEIIARLDHTAALGSLDEDIADDFSAAAKA